ncbi:hypothetical protein HDZ31DRAFT_67462 [Schizophyllum fasciatum]
MGISAIFSRRAYQSDPDLDESDEERDAVESLLLTNIGDEGAPAAPPRTRAALKRRAVDDASPYHEPNVIECHDSKCAVRWFHRRCVELDGPEEKFCCDECLSDRKKKRTRL